MENSLWVFQWLYWGNPCIIVAKWSINVEYFRGETKAKYKSLLPKQLNTWSTGKFCEKRQPLHHAVSGMFLTNSALCHLTVLRLILKRFFSIHLFWFGPHTDLAAFRTTNKVHFPWQDKCLLFICSLYLLQRLRELRQRESTRNICKFFCTYRLCRIKLLYLYNEINVTLKKCEILL